MTSARPSEPLDHHDLVWKALADPTRRAMLDVLAEGPLTTGDLAERFRPQCRTNVMKHLDALTAAELVTVRREGRHRWNHLNPLPIQHVCDRWVSKHVSRIASGASRLKNLVEGRERHSTATTSHQGDAS